MKKNAITEKKVVEEVILFTSRRRFCACSVTKQDTGDEKKLHWLLDREKVVHIMIFFLFSLLSRTTEAKSNTQ